MFLTVKNPPNPTDPSFNLTLFDVARRISLHLGNDLELFLKFATKLIGGDDKKLMEIQQSQEGLKEKCKELLNLWARRSNSKWEDVIAALREVDLSRLADELAKEFSESEQIQNSSLQGE